MLVFASNRGMKLMLKAEAWTYDSTFNIVPAPFSQFYTFMAKVEGISYICVFALLVN